MTRMSVTDDQYGRLWKRLEEVARRVREGTLGFPETMTVLQEVVEGTVQQTVGVVRLLVDYASVYNKPLSQAIKKCGFDWVEANIADTDFQVSNRANSTVEMRVFSTEDLVGKTRSVTSHEVLRILEGMGYRPAEIAELLAFGAEYQDAQRLHFIIGLGSTGGDWNGGRRVLCLGRRDKTRALLLAEFEDEWSSDCRFLAVRKS
ncbi:MAG: hypothetical protein Q8P76_03200 [bacterium]|nr:hypothetical protein [bacterium]